MLPEADMLLVTGLTQRKGQSSSMLAQAVQRSPQGCSRSHEPVALRSPAHPELRVGRLRSFQPIAALAAFTLPDHVVIFRQIDDLDQLGAS
jgi:hypothetical protein